MLSLGFMQGIPSFSATTVTSCRESAAKNKNTLRIRIDIFVITFVMSLSATFLQSAVTLGVVEEAGRIGVKRLWLQPGSENDEVRHTWCWWRLTTNS